MQYDHRFASAMIPAIRAQQGELFRQKRGGEFHYVIDGACIVPDRTNFRIPLMDVVVALDRAPFPSTTVLQDLFGPLVHLPHPHGPTHPTFLGNGADFEFVLIGPEGGGQRRGQAHSPTWAGRRDRAESCPRARTQFHAGEGAAGAAAIQGTLVGHTSAIV